MIVDINAGLPALDSPLPLHQEPSISIRPSLSHFKEAQRHWARQRLSELDTQIAKAGGLFRADGEVAMTAWGALADQIFISLAIDSRIERGRGHLASLAALKSYMPNTDGNERAFWKVRCSYRDPETGVELPGPLSFRAGMFPSALKESLYEWRAVGVIDIDSGAAKPKSTSNTYELKITSWPDAVLKLAANPKIRMSAEIVLAAKLLRDMSPRRGNVKTARLNLTSTERAALSRLIQAGIFARPRRGVIAISRAFRSLGNLDGGDANADR